jgi:hypothetical protein
MSSNPIVTPTSPTYTWADEALAKRHADSSKSNPANSPEFITSAKNPAETAAIDVGSQRGRKNLEAFDEAWGSKE